MEQGPRCSNDKISLVAKLFSMFARGGFLVEILCLPPVSLSDYTNRKELATALHKIVSDKYTELK